MIKYTKTFNIVSIVVVFILVVLTVYFSTIKKPKPFQSHVEETATTTPVSKSVQYKNNQYGFIFTLPNSWKGYTVVLDDEWNGYNTGGEISQQSVSQTGPLIFIRHPDWRENNPRQDIPIMVFTIDQWKKLQNDDFHIGAAPINPSELGRNSKYVFALPARYNYAFPVGYEEVDQILQNKPLKAF